MKEILYQYKSRARPWGAYRLLAGAVFGLGLGLLIYVNPFSQPPAWLSWMPPLVGALFMAGGLWEIYRGFRLMRDEGGWHIEVNSERVIYRTPRASREESFEIALPDIESVTVEYQPSESDAENVHYITTRAGENIPFGNAENLFNADKFIHALQKAGVPLIRKPR